MNENRIKYPSVSEVFSPYFRGSYAGMTLEQMVEIEERHSNVTCHCMSIVNNLWRMDEDNIYNLYITSFDKWFSSNVKEVMQSEIFLYDDVKRFTGRIDFICKVLNSDELVSVTIKTSSPSKSWNVQLAAYSHLCNVNALNVKRNIILKLSKKGDIATEFENENKDQDFDIFHNVLSSWHYFKGE